MQPFRLAFAVLFSGLISLSCLAQNTIHIPADQPSVQAGIVAARAGDTVLIAPGTYFENIDFLGKAITVTSSDGAAKTVIDGGGNTNTVTFKNGEPRAAILSNLTITHGFPNSKNSYSGGGIYLSGAQPTILNNIISQNYCQNIYSLSSAPLIQGNLISTSLTPEKCSVGFTGGLYIEGNLQSSNPAAGNGVPPLILGNTIQNNTTGEVGDGGGDGGPGIALWGGSPLIEGNIIRNNLTRSGSGGAVNIVFGSGVSIIQNLIYGNTAGCGGGAIGAEEGNLSPDTYLLIANNTIVDDTGGLGGGYSDCRKSSEIWTSFYTGGGPSLKVVNNIFQANLAPGLDCGYLNSTPSEPTQSLFDHNLLYDTAGNFFGSNCIDTSHLHGNLVADPQFVNLANNDFHLNPTSPAIDAGNGSVLQNLKLLSGTDLPKDFDGKPREQDTTGKGYPIIDIGAYEFSGVTGAVPTRIVLSASTLSGAAGSSFSFTASLSSSLGMPTGIANFFLDGQPVGSSLINKGIATLSNVAVKPGDHTVYASYDGQSGFQPAISVYLVLSINRYATTLSLTISPGTSISGQAVLLSVHATSADPTYIPTPIPLVDSFNNTTLATLLPDSSGNATYSTTSLGLGLHLLQVSYAGDTLHASATASGFAQVTSGYATTSTLVTSVNPSSSGQLITFTARVTSNNGTPTGSVQFTDGTNALATLPLGATGSASFALATLGVGSHSIGATYLPAGSYAGSIANLTQVVNGLPATAVLSATPTTIHFGDTVNLRASVAGAAGAAMPTGTVSFYDGAVMLGIATLSPAGLAIASTTNLLPGTNALTCAYSGDSVYSSSTCAPVYVTAQTVDTVTTLVSSGNPAPALSPVVFTATLTSNGQPNSAGTHFYLDGKPLNGVQGPNGTTSIQLNLPVGAHTITAQFAGSLGYNSSTATLTQIIQAVPTTIGVDPIPGPLYENQRIAVISTVHPSLGNAQPYGGVNLYEGNTLLASQPLPAAQNSPVTSLNLAPFTPGTHVLHAVYTPSDGNFLPSSSPAVSITVLPQTFLFTSSAPAVTIQTEHHGSVQLTLASVGGWSGPIQLGCAGPKPPVLTCELSSTVALDANGTTSTTLTLDTDAVLGFKSAVDGSRNPFSRVAPAVVLTALLLPLSVLGARGRRSSLQKLVLILLALCTAQALTGCSSKYPDHTPPGTYTLTLAANGTANGANAPTGATLQLQLTVTP